MTSTSLDPIQVKGKSVIVWMILVIVNHACIIQNNTVVHEKMCYESRLDYLSDGRIELCFFTEGRYSWEKLFSNSNFRSTGNWIDSAGSYYLSSNFILTDSTYYSFTSCSKDDSIFSIQVFVDSIPLGFASIELDDSIDHVILNELGLGTSEYFPNKKISVYVSELIYETELKDCISSLKLYISSRELGNFHKNYKLKKENGRLVSQDGLIFEMTIKENNHSK